MLNIKKIQFQTTTLLLKNSKEVAMLNELPCTLYSITVGCAIASRAIISNVSIKATTVYNIIIILYNNIMPRMAVQKKLCSQQSLLKNVKNPKLLKISKENKCIHLSTCIIYIKCRNNTSKFPFH